MRRAIPGVVFALLVCLAIPAGAQSYSWPVAPFDHQHPIRGTFDDPRTRTGRVDDDPTNPQRFHNGVDIQARDGTPVYAIEAGTVSLVGTTRVVIESGPWARTPPLIFGYWHVDPVVWSHEPVARHQLLGYVRRGAGHVHLSEQRFGRYVNPLRRGGLSPYLDSTAPVIRAVKLRPCGRAVPVATDHVTGCVDLIVDAYDPPALPLHGRWRHSALPPYKIDWGGLVTGSWLPSFALPWRGFDRFLTGSVHDVYAPGTRQNRAGSPGVYYFWLARGIDTTLMDDGPHALWVSAADTTGNTSAVTLEFTTANAVASGGS